MHIVVAGAGAVGLKVAEMLTAELNDVVVIDKDPAAAERARRLDALVLEGHAASPPVLERAEIERADVFFAVTSDDETNLVAGSQAKQAGAKRVIARVGSQELMQEPVSDRYAHLGVDVAVSPNLVAAAKIIRILEFPSVLEMDVFAAGLVRVVEARVESGSAAAGRRIAEIDLGNVANIVAIFRGPEVIVPGGDDILFNGDRVVLVMAARGDMSELEGLLLNPRHEHRSGPVEDVVIAGCTPVAVHICRLLTREGKSVRIIEESEAGREMLLDAVPEALVLRGSASEVGLLREESVGDADVFIAATDHQQFNIVTALVAKQMGVGKVVALVDQGELEPLAERIGVDVAVSPRLTAASTLLKYTHGLAPEEMSLLHHGDAQVLVVEVEEGNAVADQPLKRVSMPRGSLVGAVIRGKRAIIPRGDDVIQPGDRLVIFAKSEAVPGLHSLF